MSNHIIVCGIGTTGRHIAAELRAVGMPFVVVDKDRSELEDLNEEFEQAPLYVCGDATDDHVLAAAGVARARGVISALNDDKSNLFVTITARALNPNARIVSKSIEPSTEAKLRRAGADADGDYVYAPGSEQLLQQGDSLIVLAESQDVKNLRASIAAGAGV